MTTSNAHALNPPATSAFDVAFQHRKPVNTTSTDKIYDIVVIGSGAGGASLAQAIAPTGKSVLILERGDYLPVEAENWNPFEVHVKKRYRTTERWRDKNDKPFTPNTHYWVGGNTIFYGAAMFRFRREDFQKVIHHGGGVSPAWPIDYDDLSPYYLEAEHLWNVRGSRRQDPAADHAAPPFPHPALPHDHEIDLLKSRLETVGLNPFSMPLALDRDEAKPNRSPCIRCTTCDSFPCLREAKTDGRKMVRRALGHDNVSLMTGAKVTKLETSPDGRRIAAVAGDGADGPFRVRGEIVVLAAGAINSALIMLKSANDAHPAGLGNSSDQVGRNYMFHTSSASLAFAWPKVSNDFMKTLALSDYYWRDPDGEFDFPMGQIQMLEHIEPNTIRGQLAMQFSTPHWLVPDWAAEFIGDRVLPFLIMSEDLPEARNRVRLTEDGGVKLDYWHNNLVAHKRLIDKFHSAMARAGRKCQCVRGYRFPMDGILPLYGTAHQCGTLRMGRDAKSSVVDADCRAHDLENLYVADASVFASSAAVNPALTVVANALRVADVIRAL